MPRYTDAAQRLAIAAILRLQDAGASLPEEAAKEVVRLVTYLTAATYGEELVGESTTWVAEALGR